MVCVVCGGQHPAPHSSQQVERGQQCLALPRPISPDLSWWHSVFLEGWGQCSQVPSSDPQKSGDNHLSHQSRSRALASEPASPSQAQS